MFTSRTEEVGKPCKGQQNSPEGHQLRLEVLWGPVLKLASFQTSFLVNSMARTAVERGHWERQK